jgi:hypothetical protein
MPKVRDLAINTVPSKEQAKGYWMCQKSTPPPPQSSNCDKEKPKKYTESLSPDVVSELRQQLHQRIHG